MLKQVTKIKLSESIIACWSEATNFDVVARSKFYKFSYMGWSSDCKDIEKDESSSN